MASRVTVGWLRALGPKGYGKGIVILIIAAIVSASLC